MLLRESFREGAKVRKRTLANLSSLSPAQVEAIRAVLGGQTMQLAAQSLQITASRSHGHVQAVALAMRRLALASLLGSKPSRQRDLVLAMVAARIVAPHTKLATALVAHHHAGRGLRRGRCQRERPVCGDGCAVVLFLGTERLVVDFMRGRQPLSPYYDTWLKSPLHGSASGKIVLAWLPEPEREQILGPGPYTAHTSATVTDPDIFREQLKDIRHTGYAVARGDAYEDMVAIAVPLMMATHSRPLGCVVVSSPIQLVPENAHLGIIANLKAAAALLVNSAPSLQVLRHWTPRNARR